MKRYRRLPLNRKEDIVHASGYAVDDGIKLAKKLLGQKRTPDAIFATNDSIAISAMRIAEKLNFSILEDISIIGFDDGPHSAYFAPSLSTLWQPVYGMGMHCARISFEPSDKLKK